jgi:hypothetical protein
MLNALMPGHSSRPALVIGLAVRYRLPTVSTGKYLVGYVGAVALVVARGSVLWLAGPGA